MLLLAGDTKVVVFSDFDGTITLNDSNGILQRQTIPLRVDYLTDHLGFGVEKRLALSTAVLDKSRTFRFQL
jgi:2-hydroxy-3-keto-5-methylthiopentenyl-1-phosphate phosphatase